MPEASRNIEGQTALVGTDASAAKPAQAPRADLGKRQKKENRHGRP